VPEAWAAGAAESAASSAAGAAAAKPERRGWFGRGKAAEPAPEIVGAKDAAEQKLLDLAPVREAMEAVGRRSPAAEEEGAPAVAGLAGGGAAVSAIAAARRTSAAASAALDRIGVLLVNLGTPDAAQPKAVRRYLREFLSDPRVIEKDTLTWRLVLKGIILPLRPRSKARAYRKIWNLERNESPLKTITRSQAEQLAEALASIDKRVLVDWAMRYGNPSIEARMRSMIAQGCERVLVVPLYPQYSSATTATVCDETFRVLARIRNQPAVRIAPAYYDDPVYIEAIASSMRTAIGEAGFKPEVIVASYHGMPLEYVEKGDPYYRHCARTTELLRERLGMNASNLIMTFQSRFGRDRWLEPYTDQTLRKLAKDGVKNVAVVTPGFAADCLETLEEIAIENAHIFKKKGGKKFLAIPCLNDSGHGMVVINELVMRELKGWL
jgi:ferrochelatase